MSPRRIIFVSGTRADFGKLKPLMREVEADAGFECHVFATGMHMLAAFGYTFREIEKVGFSRVFPYYNQTLDSHEAMDFVLANTVTGLGHYVREVHPDLIVVHGDRVEALAGATCGALNGVLVAHVEGGELSGTVDEIIRHSVSKLAHVHFVANEDAKRRVLQLGERENSVFVVGSPDIDVMLSDGLPTLDEVREHYEIPFADFALLIYHPVTTELEELKSRVGRVLEAVRCSGHRFVVIHPNNDSGSSIIRDGVLGLADAPERFRVLPSVRFEAFLTLLKNARFILGNSSAGIREAPVYGVPTIDLGSRQRGRFSHSSIINVDEEADAIREAMTSVDGMSHEPSFHFGDGKSAARFMEALRGDELWSLPCQKLFEDRQFD